MAGSIECKLQYNVGDRGCLLNMLEMLVFKQTKLCNPRISLSARMRFRFQTTMFENSRACMIAKKGQNSKRNVRAYWEGFVLHH